MTVRDDALKRMQVGIARSEGTGQPFISICADVAAELVAEQTTALDGFHPGIFASIIAERARQDRKFGGYENPRSILPNGSNYARLGVTTEELGEVAKAVNELYLEEDRTPNSELAPCYRRPDWRENLKDELVQTAACCVAWLEALEHEEALSDQPS